MSISFTGPEQVNTYTMLVLKSAMKFYLNSGGMKVNRAYTPTNMLRAAGGFTGKTYKRNQMPQAIADLENLLSLSDQWRTLVTAWRYWPAQAGNSGKETTMLDMEMYSYRGHTLVAMPAGVLIHVGSEDGPLVAKAKSLDTAMLAIDAMLRLFAVALVTEALDAIVADANASRH